MNENGKNTFVEGGNDRVQFMKKLKKALILGYSGGLIRNHWYWKNLIIKLSGIKFNRTKFPVLLNHKVDQKIGWSYRPTISDAGLEVEAFMMDTPAAKEFSKGSKSGFPYQASIYAKPLKTRKLELGETEVVNGISVKGPASIWDECEYMESSVAVFGWDPHTRSEALALDDDQQELQDSLVAQNLAGLVEANELQSDSSLSVDDQQVVDDLLKCVR